MAGALVDGAYRRGDVDVDRTTGRIAAVGLREPGRGIAVPGLVDLQVNGFAGVDFLTADVDAYAHAGAALARTGVVAYQPTLITSAVEQTVAAIATADKARVNTSGARILGVHLEGPFLSPRRPGTHPVDLLRSPDVALLQRLLDAGSVTQVTLAPELPGALDLADLCVRADVIVSCGHSDATAPEANAAFDRGARLVTHLFDAMRPFAHRDPGIASAALTREGITVGLIADPSHLAPETVRLDFQAAGGRVALVTDALAASGCPDGHFRLGEVGFDVLDGVARRGDGTLVGTTTTLIQGIRNAVAAGVALDVAVNATTRTPAGFFPGADLGLLRRGDRADIVVLDDSLDVRDIFHLGERVER
ncbi:MAG: N-acetylglucosamine-6-phosphate deacetylase [Umezawaea sp.]